MPTLRSLLPALALAALAASAQARDQWTTEVADAWFAKQPFMAGCNYVPRTAISELEMWQAETWDPKTIDQELGWAEGLGFNAMRVFLHNLPWDEDHSAYLQRIEEYLAIADRHHIRTMFVLFDSCWDANPKPGRQPEPRRNVHNSGWVQAPGRAILSDPARHDSLKGYVEGIIGHFRADPRILLWDLFNEYDNGDVKAEGYDKPARALELATKTRSWALALDPVQPLSICIWADQEAPVEKLSPTQRFAVTMSDVNTFHAYTDLAKTRSIVAALRAYHRPLICTEYMARPTGSTFTAILPYFRAEGITAINWGFVDGKSQTKFPWDSWHKPYPDEPVPWFHDVLRADGTPYDAQEAAVIRTAMGK